MLVTFLRGFLFSILFLLFVGATFAAGFTVQQSLAPAPAAAPASAQAPSPAATAKPATSAESDFAVFWEVWGIVKAEFIGKIPDDQAMTYAAIHGLVDTLGDQHTHFDEPIQAGIGDVRQPRRPQFANASRREHRGTPLHEKRFRRRSWQNCLEGTGAFYCIQLSRCRESGRRKKVILGRCPPHLALPKIN